MTNGIVPSRKRVRSQAGQAPGRAASNLPVVSSFKNGDRKRNLVLPQRRPAPGSFEVQIVEGGTQQETVVLFDAYLFQTNATSYVQPASITITGITQNYASTVAFTVGNPFLISGINYSASDSLFNTLNIFRRDLDGAVENETIVPDTARRNTQFQSTLLTLAAPQIFDGSTALQFLVNLSQTVRLTMFIKTVFNRLT